MKCLTVSVLAILAFPLTNGQLKKLKIYKIVERLNSKNGKLRDLFRVRKTDKDNNMDYNEVKRLDVADTYFDPYFELSNRDVTHRHKNKVKDSKMLYILKDLIRSLRHRNDGKNVGRLERRPSHKSDTSSSNVEYDEFLDDFVDETRHQRPVVIVDGVHEDRLAPKKQQWHDRLRSKPLRTFDDDDDDDQDRRTISPPFHAGYRNDNDN